MSHVASIEIQVNDLDSLAKTCDELGLELVRGQKTHKWYGKWVNDYHGEDAAFNNGIDPKDYGKCDHAIRVKGNNQAYEIGVVQTEPGKYQLVYDFYAGGHGLMNKISNDGASGKDCGKLMQGYAKNVTIKKANRMGYNVREGINADGSIRLKLTR